MNNPLESEPQGWQEWLDERTCKNPACPCQRVTWRMKAGWFIDQFKAFRRKR